MHAVGTLIVAQAVLQQLAGHDGVVQWFTLLAESCRQLAYVHSL
jgi:hypothetical protein